MSPCNIHKSFFDENCHDCKLEYAELKGLDKSMIQDDKTAKKISNKSSDKKVYKEFSEERAKKLYEELLIQFLRTKSVNDEVEAARRARQIIRKQCAIRGIQIWSWLK